MHTYVSLTLAKTPHLPIKRRKVIHIGQPRNRRTCDRASGRAQLTRAHGQRQSRGGGSHVAVTCTVAWWGESRGRARGRPPPRASLAAAARDAAAAPPPTITNRARMFSSSLLGETWTPFGNCFSWHHAKRTPGAIVRKGVALLRDGGAGETSTKLAASMRASVYTREFLPRAPVGKADACRKQFRTDVRLLNRS